MVLISEKKIEILIFLKKNIPRKEKEKIEKKDQPHPRDLASNISTVNVLYNIIIHR